MSQVLYGESYDQLSSGETHAMTKDSVTIANVRLSFFAFSFLLASNRRADLDASLFVFVPQTLTDGPFNVFISWVKSLDPRFRAANRRSKDYVVERVEKAREKIRGGGEIEKVESMVSLSSSLLHSFSFEKLNIRWVEDRHHHEEGSEGRGRSSHGGGRVTRRVVDL